MVGSRRGRFGVFVSCGVCLSEERVNVCVKKPGVGGPYFLTCSTILNGYPCRYSLLPAAALDL